MTVDEIANILAQTMKMVAEARNLDAADLNPDITAHHTLRNAFARAIESHVLNSAHQKSSELYDCLNELTGLVNGECPSLLNEDLGGNAPLAMRIEDALNKE